MLDRVAEFLGAMQSAPEASSWARDLWLQRDLDRSKFDGHGVPTMAVNLAANAIPWLSRLALNTNVHRAQTICHCAKPIDREGPSQALARATKTPPLDPSLEKKRGAILLFPTHHRAVHQRGRH